MRFSWMFLLTLVVSAQVEEKPANLTVSTWVREDIFAGFLDNEMTRFAQGERKLEQILAANPKAADAVCWKGGAVLYRAVRAHEAGDAAGFAELEGQAKALFARCASIAEQIPPYRPAVHAITGGSYAAFGDRLPASRRKEVQMTIRTNYESLREVQKANFDQMPAHHRGEVLGGLAQASVRLGEMDRARTELQTVVAALPGTPYAAFASRWLSDPGAMGKGKLTCASCHEPGRLAAVRGR